MVVLTAKMRLTIANRILIPAITIAILVTTGIIPTTANSIDDRIKESFIMYLSASNCLWVWVLVAPLGKKQLVLTRRCKRINHQGFARPGKSGSLFPSAGLLLAVPFCWAPASSDSSWLANGDVNASRTRGLHTLTNIRTSGSLFPSAALSHPVDNRRCYGITHQGFVHPSTLDPKSKPPKPEILNSKPPQTRNSEPHTP